MNLISWLTNTINVKIYLDDKYVKTVCISKKKIKNWDTEYVHAYDIRIEIINYVRQKYVNENTYVMDNRYIGDVRPLKDCNIYFRRKVGDT